MPKSNHAHVPLLSLCSRARELQVLSPYALEPMLHNKRTQLNEKPVHHNEKQPPLITTRGRKRKAEMSEVRPTCLRHFLHLSAAFLGNLLRIFYQLTLRPISSFTVSSLVRWEIS